MSALVLDAGALIAVDRGDRAAMARLAVAAESGVGLRTNPMVVAQVWRGGGRAANLARVLAATQVAALDEAAGRAAGELCGAAGTSDPIDASLALLAEPGDWILTSDPDDIERLVEARGAAASIVRV